MAIFRQFFKNLKFKKMFIEENNGIRIISKLKTFFKFSNEILTKLAERNHFLNVSDLSGIFLASIDFPTPLNLSKEILSRFYRDFCHVEILSFCKFATACYSRHLYSSVDEKNKILKNLGSFLNPARRADL